MAIYFGTTEITKLRDLAPQSGLDITDIWLGETNVYTVWQTYEGTLPATINANGDDMKQYQIYGNTGGVGELTRNILDESTLVKGFYARIDNNIQIDPVSSGSTVYRSFRQSLAPGTYTISFSNNVYLARVIVDGVMSENAGADISSYTVTTQTGDIGFSMRRTTSSGTPWDNNPTMLTEGTTAPASFVPFGYEVDMRIGSWSPYATHTGTIIDMTTGGENSTQQYSTAYFNNFFPSTAIITVKADTAGGGRTLRYMPYDENQAPMLDYKVEVQFVRDGREVQQAVTIPSSAAYYGVSYHNGDTQKKISTTTPIYIGNEPLDKDEYVDYEAGKVYRMIDSTLTPTDPPVALPALPTCEGETVIEYTGQSVALEKVLLKYRKEGF